MNLCTECHNYDEHNSECELEIETEDITLDKEKLKIISCIHFDRKYICDKCGNLFKFEIGSVIFAQFKHQKPKGICKNCKAELEKSEKSFHERRIEEVKAQQTLSPGGTDELDPIIKEIQQGKYAELHIQLKTKDGIEFNFDYPKR